MELYRNIDELCEQMDVEDCQEVFMGILKGSGDFSASLFEDLMSEYAVDWIKVEELEV